MLILECCPITADLLCQDQMSSVEAHSLVDSVVRNTGLNVTTSRYLLGALLKACKVKTDWSHIPVLKEMLTERRVKPEDSAEYKVSILVSDLKRKGETPEIIAALDDLANNGCARAAYALGTHYKENDLQNGTNVGEAYFQMASNAGFGPANGALAQYEINRHRKNMRKAARYFYGPTTLAGAEGREWIPLSKQLLDYRKENEVRLSHTLIVQAVVLILSLLLVYLLGIRSGIWRTVAIGLQIVGLGWTMFCLRFSPYSTAGCADRIMTLSWLILIIAGL